MKFALVGFLWPFLVSPVEGQQADKEYIESLETGCAFGIDEDCDKLVEIEETGKSVSLTLCNRTEETVRVAIANEVGEVRERRYHARGWHALAPQECHAFWEWPVKDASYHVPLVPLIHATSDSGLDLSGSDAMLCTPDDDFDIMGDHLGDCEKRGYIKIDLITGGWHKKGRTLDLTP